MINAIVSIYFGSPQLGYKVKTNCMKLQRHAHSLFFKKGSVTSFSTTFCA